MVKAVDIQHSLTVRAREAAQDGIQRIIADLKERAAANPTAILAIGAGLAWRLIHQPPIASLLVGDVTGSSRSFSCSSRKAYR